MYLFPVGAVRKYKKRSSFSKCFFCASLNRNTLSSFLATCTMTYESS